MPTDDILIRFKADTGQLKAEFDELSSNLKKVAQEEKKSSDQSKVTAKEITEAGKRRNALLTAEIQVLKQLEQQQKKAFTPKDIAEFNSKIAQSQKNISLLKGEGDKLAGSNSILGSSFAKLGGLIVAAFSVSQIIAFGNTAVNEFAKAEKSAFQLLGALNGNTGAQKRLLDLAKEFQQRFGIDNDVIVAQESFLAIQGRTETQIKKTIQAAIQLSAVTGEDLGSAVQKLDGTFEGITGRLGKLDSRITGLSKSQLANGAAVDIINEKYAGFAEKGLEGVAGQLQRIQVQTDEATKKLGEAFAPIKLFFVDTTKDIVEFFGKVVDGIKSFAGLSTADNEITKFKNQQLALSLKALEDFNKEKLLALQAADERELANSKNLTEKQKAFIQSEIDAIKQLILIKEKDAEASKKALEITDEDAKKALEALQKEDKEKRDAQTALAKFTFDEQNKNADKEAAERKKNAEETIESEKLLQLELLKIDADTLQIKLQNAKDTFQDTAAIEIAITDNLRAQAKLRNDILKGGGEIHPNKEDYDKWLKDSADANKKFAEEFEKTFDKIGQSATALVDVLNAGTESQIQSLTDSAQRQNDSFDQQEQHLQDLVDAHKISEKEFDKQSKTLADSRAKAEKASQEKIKALKLEEARREKALAVFTIGLDIAKHLSAVPPDFFGAALAASQLVAVLAKPLPAFKKGTRGKQGSGLALVGEEGAELTYLPSQAKVLPANRTRQYSDVIDSMFDGKLDAYIHKNYILPALKLQSPNVNINIDYKKLAKANKQRDSISIDNLHELAEMFDHNPRRVI